MFILRIFIPAMLPIWCFFADLFFRTAFLFLRSAAFGLGFVFGLLIPGILDMSCP
jgi:hypothetical protein